MSARERQSLNSDCGGATEFLYRTAPGRALLKILVARRLSRAVGFVLDRGLSRAFIKPFIRGNGIDLTDFKQERYKSFNGFFTRDVKTGARPLAKDGLISPCDGLLTVFDINDKTRFSVKGRTYSVFELLRDEKLAAEYAGGVCMVFRLRVQDYHHYCYIDNGIKGRNVYIKGVLHTVRPVACGETDVYKENCREYTVMETDNYGKVVQIEVGAMLVGRICNLHGEGRISRGAEKGRFEFGGSTIIMLFKKDTVKPDGEFIKNSAAGYETRVKIGERIGK